MVVLSNISEKINNSEINAFEKQFEIELPKDYKEFLINNNGGYPTELLLTPEFEEVDPTTLESRGQAINVERFFSLNEIAFEYEDILDETYIPAEYIPFANTAFGNLILIYVGSKKDYGSIYFSNHDLFDENNDCFTLSKISNSFSEFIDSLYVSDLD